ncbi:MAG: lipopolysaccharide heptosyltransferase II [Gemmatimonadota bacterium]
MTAGPTLVIQTAFLGDVVLTTPLLSALAEQFGPVDVVTTPGAAALLEGHPAVRAVVPHDKHRSERGIGGIFRLAKRLRAEGYQRAYLPHRSWRSGMAALLAGIPERIGFEHAPARWSYTRRVPRDPTLHEVPRLLALADAPDRYPLSLGISTTDDASAAAWLDLAGVPEQFVALAPGSIWGTKRWGKFPELAAALDTFVVTVGGPEDRALGESVVAAAKSGGVNAAGQLPLRVSAALLGRATALVSNDSAPMHMAQAMGTPVVALFGPTVPSFGFAPRGPEDVVLEVDGLNCRPCSSHGPRVCPLGHHHCMTELELVRVLAALEPLLSPA